MTVPRLQGLDAAAIQQVISTAQALNLGQAGQAAALLAPMLASHPDHPEVLRLHAGILNLRGDFSAALAVMQRAIQLRPADPLYHNTLGTVLGASGDFDAAVSALKQACKLQPDLAIAWYNLGVMLTRCVRHDEAAEALRNAVKLMPGHMEARALLGDMMRVRGEVEAAAAEYRKVLAEQPWTGMAWWGLADLRIDALTPDDVESMRTALRDARANDDDRIAIGFALAKVLDEQGRYSESLDALKLANETARLRFRWDSVGFSANIAAINAAFTPPPSNTTGSDLGHGVIFITGLPRSGTTLVEQILASHSQVEGAGELPDLPLTLTEESQRRRMPFPTWVSSTPSADWHRLGKRYLERTVHWRAHRPVSTDKLPANWMYIGAIRAMLPGARIIICRRDPVETCFSCYRQHLANNEYTRTFGDLAAYWRDFDKSTRHWSTLHPANIYQHSYEAFLTDPERGTHKLLSFCGLPFEEACMRFQETAREVRSPSATQVRQPLYKDTARAQRYGTLLDPLRKVLRTAIVE